MKRISMIFAVALATLVATSAMAQQQRDGQRREEGNRGSRGASGMMRMFPVMAALDADGDGEISSQEIEGAVAALKGLDKDKDGKLAGEELRPSFSGARDGATPGAGGRGFGNPEAFVERLMQRDTNKDGKLSQDEVSEQMQGMIRRADRDDDGAATKEELLASFRRASEGQAGGRGFGGRPNSEAFVNRALEYDADKDGKLSTEELTKWAEQMGRGFGGGRDGDDRPQRSRRSDANDNN
jgi:Ca2+-binding EF-hand superfamily protein